MLTRIAVFAAILGVASIAPQAALAQTGAASAIQPKPYVAARTSFGQPNLEGTWTNNNATPLERPKELEGRQFLTDAELAEMTRWFERHTLEQRGRYRVVEPRIVVEVAFDVLMRSSRHRSGFALRFPRIARLRQDKGPEEIDTLGTVERLYAELQPGA